MANMVCAIANRGYYIKPHLLKSVQEYGGSFKELEYEKSVTSIDPEHFELVIEGMERVINESLLRSTTRVDSLFICGKTGTVQHGRPNEAAHSVFIAFAPKDDPKIAISVYIENGVWGSRYAAPMASLMIEKYLTGEISPNRRYIEKRMMDANLITNPDLRR
jgi:penicillin-binding protein 2